MSENPAPRIAALIFDGFLIVYSIILYFDTGEVVQKLGSIFSPGSFYLLYTVGFFFIVYFFSSMVSRASHNGRTILPKIIGISLAIQILIFIVESMHMKSIPFKEKLVLNDGFHILINLLVTIAGLTAGFLEATVLNYVAKMKENRAFAETYSLAWRILLAIVAAGALTLNDYLILSVFLSGNVASSIALFILMLLLSGLVIGAVGQLFIRPGIILMRIPSVAALIIYLTVLTIRCLNAVNL